MWWRPGVSCVCAAISSLIAEIILNASRMWPSYFLFSVLISVLCVWKRSLALCFHKIESEKRATQHRLRASQCKTESSYSFIHFQYPLLSDLGVTGGQLESLPAVVWRRQGDTPDKLPLHCPRWENQPFALTGKLEFPIHQTCMFLDTEIQTVTERTSKFHTERCQAQNGTHNLLTAAPCRPVLKMSH